MIFKKHNLKRQIRMDIKFMALNVDNEELYNAYKIYLGVIIKRHWALVKEIRFNFKPNERACWFIILDYMKLRY